MGEPGIVLPGTTEIHLMVPAGRFSVTHAAAGYFDNPIATED